MGTAWRAVMAAGCAKFSGHSVPINCIISSWRTEPGRRRRRRRPKNKTKQKKKKKKKKKKLGRVAKIKEPFCQPTRIQRQYLWVILE
jgi:hypothetical protein